MQAAANFEAALDDGFDYYCGNLGKCRRALRRLGERSDSYAQWKPLPSGAKFDVDGILRIDGDSLVPAGCYRARSGEQLIVGQHDVDEGMRVDRRFEVLRCARMVEFNLAMRGSVENRSTVRITFDELGAALEQELGVMGQREFLQLGPEDAAALRGSCSASSWPHGRRPISRMPLMMIAWSGASRCSAMRRAFPAKVPVLGRITCRFCSRSCSVSAWRTCGFVGINAGSVRFRRAAAPGSPGGAIKACRIF